MKRTFRFIVLVLGASSLLAVGGALSLDLETGVEPPILWESTLLSPYQPGLVVRILTTADLNADGFEDLVCCESDYTEVFWGSQDIPFIEQWPLVFEWEVQTESNGSVTWRETPEQIFPKSAVALDLDDDTDLDLLVSGCIYQRDADPLYRLYAFENQGIMRVGVCGDLEPAAMPVPQGFVTMIPLPTVPGEPKELLALSLEESMEFRRYSAYRVQVDARIAKVEQLDFTESGYLIDTSDLDGDGLPDLAFRHYETGISIYSFDGTDLRLVTTIPPELTGFSGDFADVDEDGWQEYVAVLDHRLCCIEISAWTPEVTFISSFEMDEGGAVFLVDLDDEVGVDAFVTSDNQAWRRYLFPGTRDGSFADPICEYQLRIPGLPAASVDLDGNGRMDLVLQHTYHASVLMNGMPAQGLSRFPAHSASLLDAADIDQDGDADLLLANGRGLEVMENLGQGSLSRRAFATGFDADVVSGAIGRGSMAVLIKNAEEGSLLLVLDQNGGIHEEYVLGFDVIPSILAANLDENPDSEYVGLGAGRLWIVWNADELVSYEVDLSASLVSAGDYDNDGLDEIAYLRSIDEIEAVFCDCSLAFLSIEATHALPSKYPLATTTVDADGDGRMDLIAASVGFAAERVEDEVIIQAGGVTIVSVGIDGTVGEIALEGLPQGQLPWAFTGVAAGDLSGDGVPNYVVSTGDDIGLYIGRCARDGRAMTDAIAGRATSLRCADLDGNGVPEVVTTTQGLNDAIWILWNGGNRP